MSKIDDFYEMFLDEVEVDIDFDSKSKKLQAKSAESRFRDQYEFPTLTQLLNQKSSEFMQALFADIDPYIEVEFEDLSEYNDVPAYRIEIKFDSKIELSSVNLTEFFFDMSEIQTDQETANVFAEFFKDNKFNENWRSYQTKFPDFRLEIKNIEQLNSIMQRIENFSEPYKKITELDEAIVTSFKKFRR